MVLWNPQVLNDTSFGVVANHFGFTITGTSSTIVVVSCITHAALFLALGGLGSAQTPASALNQCLII